MREEQAVSMPGLEVGKAAGGVRMTGDHPDILVVRFGGAESFQTPPSPGSLEQLLLTFW